MRQFTECLACSCLIDARDPACPFCGAAAPRSSSAPPWLALGFVLGLGMSDIGCVEKGGDTDSTVSASNTNSTPTNGEETTVDDTFPDASTYGGPDDTSATITSTSVTSSGDDSTSTSTTQDPTNDSFPDASTYGGPDESTSLSETTVDTETDDTETQGTETQGTETHSTESTIDPTNGDGSTYGGPDESTG
jgi:hypothetical protein